MALAAIVTSHVGLGLARLRTGFGIGGLVSSPPVLLSEVLPEAPARDRHRSACSFVGTGLAFVTMSIVLGDLGWPLGVAAMIGVVLNASAAGLFALAPDHYPTSVRSTRGHCLANLHGTCWLDHGRHRGLRPVHRPHGPGAAAPVLRARTRTGLDRFASGVVVVTAVGSDGPLALPVRTSPASRTTRRW
ncbi:hypothetical protein [Pseudonocardia xinjiangensis]|uniref:hypothetical protein n=1 Tax=Pseudonocardia xinjiangensis TaxID=75289 RepID=UPI001B7D0CD2|nr:hypothetical protein [Pseudonocardia xinjiangensis]